MNYKKKYKLNFVMMKDTTFIVCKYEKKILVDSSEFETSAIEFKILHIEHIVIKKSLK